MTIALDKEESEKYFYNSLCNGLYYFSGYGIRLSVSEEDYTEAKKVLALAAISNNSPCYEDVLMQVLRNGGKLSIVDEEGGEDSEQNVSITLADVHERVSLTPIEHLAAMVNENDDATTADVILQTVFFKETIYA